MLQHIFLSLAFVTEQNTWWPDLIGCPTRYVSCNRLHRNLNTCEIHNGKSHIFKGNPPAICLFIVMEHWECLIILNLKSDIIDLDSHAMPCLNTYIYTSTHTCIGLKIGFPPNHQILVIYSDKLCFLGESPLCGYSSKNCLVPQESLEPVDGCRSEALAGSRLAG